MTIQDELSSIEFIKLIQDDAINFAKLVQGYLSSYEFMMFKDNTLRESACSAVDAYFSINSKTAAKHQLYSIPSVFQGGGVKAVQDLVDKQKVKNSKEENKEFWRYIDGIFFEQTGQYNNSLMLLIKNLCMKKKFIQPHESAETKQNQNIIKKHNRRVIDQVLENCLGTYIEHFNSHYFYTMRN